MSASKVLSQWSANDIRYSLRLLIASPPQVFVIAVGPRIANGADADVRVSAEPIPTTEVAHWLALPDDARTARAEALLAPSRTASRRRTTPR